ncbi:hypothetical protein Hamer_G022660 [Homarus americanus]|uniref:Uncharacterized protein n=1 Tax=Homarus americanus TaxID=6706 RepID=A0A8J5KAI2_HOMAM|nr:hypothetical protein Hamer_G022660 [Homarus americanus]
MTLQIPTINLDSVALRESSLGDHSVLHNRKVSKSVKSPVRFDHIAPDVFGQLLSQCDQPLVDGDLYVTTRYVCNTLYECARASRVRDTIANHNVAMGRWERLLGDNDGAHLWRAINWRGELNNAPHPGTSYHTTR